MSDNPFDDPDLYQGIHDDAQEYKENHQDYGDYPLFYLDDGSYWLRVWPEIVQRGEKKRLIVVRVIHSHKGFYTENAGDDGGKKKDYVRRLPCEGPGCRICAQVKRLDEHDFDDAWRYARREEGIIKANIFKTDVGSNDFIVVNKPAFIILARKAVGAFQTFVADLDPADLQKVFDPSKKAPQLKIAWKGGGQGGASIGFDIKEVEMPELPTDFPKINDVFIDDEKFATDQELAIVKETVGRLIAEKLNLFEPDEDEKPDTGPIEDDDIPSKKAEKAKDQPKETKSEKAASDKGDAEEAKPEKVEKKAEKPAEKESVPSKGECPSDDDALAFGKHPEEQSFDCIVCPVEAECIKATGG